MRKEKMLIRTVKTDVVKVRTFDEESGEFFTVEVPFSGDIKNAKKVMDFCREVIDTDTVHALSVESIEKTEAKYKMPLSVFLKYATPVKAGEEVEEI